MLSISRSLALRASKPIFLSRFFSSKTDSSCTSKFLQPLNRNFSIGRILRSEKFDAVQTKVAKDVILFHHENPKFFKMLNLFGVSQFAFWMYLSYCATTLKDVPVKEDSNAPWWMSINLGEKKYKRTITIVSFLIGYGILAAGWFYTLKAVRYLILRKGGTEVSFVCYTPFGENRITTIPLKNLSCPQSRQACKVQLPIKAKNLRTHFVLDMKGEFKNPKLFDNTVGLKRNLK
ncbi:transmembrane protein 223 [Neocloeon triangulifer]|uniref:transmembrane protein 223 n=1 Tax=Neocloeon triangulifer TaxID=2078957 RepID=UPI00286F6E50|nr:transmembrane protein 223 [Neocloeon triangulifer]